MELIDIREMPDTVTKIKSVEESGDSYFFGMVDGFSFGIEKKYGVKPKVGDSVWLYGKFGRPIRGVVINHDVVFYRTVEEQEKFEEEEEKEEEEKEKKEFLKNKYKLDAAYDKLPDIFKQRIDRFRTNNPDFRWKYESYELFCCEEAIKIAKALKTPEAIKEWSKSSYEKQKKKVDISDEHSGNTLGIAIKLAYFYLTNPDNVVKLHGALAGLVGSEDYGCKPRDEIITPR